MGKRAGDLTPVSRDTQAVTVWAEIVGEIVVSLDAATPAVRVAEILRALWRAVIFPSNRVRIVIAIKPVDFRKGHDGLAALVKNELTKEPFTGTVSVFRARTDRLKLLYRNGIGLVMTYKRLEETTFTWLRSAMV